MNAAADKIREILGQSENVVVIGGLNVMRESGLNGVRAEHIAYDIEQEYGYSNDEIVSSMFFSRRVDTFYDYYKKIILNKELEITPVHEAMYKLQQDGKLDAIITRTVYSLYRKAGCEDVIEMHGSVEENRCPVCGKEFDSEYIRQAKGIPVCDVCQIPLRPGFTLLGEMVDNGKMTMSSNAVAEADVLLIVGASLTAPVCQHLIKYYTGEYMIVINTEEKTGDEKADYRVYGNLSQIMTYVTDY